MIRCSFSCIQWRTGIGILCLLSAVSDAYAQNAAWATYRGDMSRSGISSETVSVPLHEAWQFQSKYPPQPAWPGPARRDGWHKTENMKARVIFDWAFHVVSDGGAVYFGSSTDDKVYCLDAVTGDEKWSFFTEGPIRLAPTLSDGKVYVGSDDGYVYCIDAATGEQAWKYTPAPYDQRVSGHGRMISVWPIRTGVLVDGGIAYFCGGLFPNEGVYLCALNAKDGSELWKKELKDVPPQGYMLASSTKLYIPTGRDNPVVVNRKDGEFLYALSGSGGAFCLLANDALIYGPGKTGEMEAFSAETSDHLATFRGNTMIVTAERSYMHTDTELSALDRIRYREISVRQKQLELQNERLKKQLKELGKDANSEKGKKLKEDMEAIRIQLGLVAQALAKCVIWKETCKYPYSLILAGGTLFAGGTGEVAAIDSKSGQILWTAPVEGRALDLALANGRLIASTDQGAIHCFDAVRSE